MAQLKIRPARPDDAPGMCDVLNPIIRTGGTTALASEMDAAAMTDAVLERAGMIAVHVALDTAGTVAGFQWLSQNPDLPDDIGDIATFARPRPKLRGVGTALFAATCDAARATGRLRAINATIRADNTGGLAYYAKMGFVDHDVTRAVPLADGRPVDRISKRYVL